MTISDEQELHRLAAMLESIDRGLGHQSPQREAIKKAGIALSLAFMRGLRADIEQHYERLGTPLTDTERMRLQSLGIDHEET